MPHCPGATPNAHTLVLAALVLLPESALSDPIPAGSSPPPDVAPPAPSVPDPTEAARIDALERRLVELDARAKRAEQHALDVDQTLAAIARADAARANAEKKAKEDADAAASDASPAVTPFDFADFSWIPGNYSGPKRPLTFAGGVFTGEFRVDTAYHFSFTNPADDTIGGSSEVFRHGELQLTQLGIGGDFYYKGLHGRLMTQFGMYSQTTPRNDASTARGQWNLDDAYRYLSEAYAGYHIDALAGINLQAGIFMSYVGLWSYYNFDNWTYQPSYVSSNTPWFFNGVRVQIFPNKYLKIEPWLVNGWQAYGRFNEAPGAGLQVNWRPNGWLSVLGNQYVGTDTLGNLDRGRFHSDESVMLKYFDAPGGAVSKIAASLTLDGGCEFGGGVTCGDQYFIGFMAYNRFWFAGDHVGLTVGGGAIRNPGRYLVLIPPINGATAYSGTPYFTAAPGDPFDAWDVQTTLDYMPVPYVIFRGEFTHRAASVPYFAGPNGMTPPGGNQGSPGSTVDGWAPDLRKYENRVTAAVMIKL